MRKQLLFLSFLLFSLFAFCQLNPFITTWKTDNPGFSEDNQIAITTQGSGYNYTVDWGDGSSDTGVTGNILHTYATEGTYSVSITGDFPRIFFREDFAGDFDSDKILSVDQWGDNAWSSMSRAFQSCENLDVIATDLPDLSNVTSMTSMFGNCSSLIGNSSFNNWDVSNVTSMVAMFSGAAAFNQNIGNWDVGNVSSMAIMFSTATAFNQDIGNWDVGNVSSMPFMFQNASTFDQDLGSWNVIKVTDMEAMFSGASLSINNYDALLEGWSTLPLRPNVLFDVGSSQYCDGEMARQNIIDTFGWFIFDGGKSTNCPEFEGSFVSTWKTDNQGTSANNQITIPTFSGETYNYTIEWGDGSSDSGVTGDITHTYPETGTYVVSISGVFPQIYFNSGGDRKKIVTIDQWGENAWSSMKLAFSGCSNLDVVAQDVPDLHNVNSLFGMFYRCSFLVGNETFNLWDTSEIVDMSSLFADAVVFNKELSNWDVSNVVKMGYMFTRASLFNQDISEWDVSNVTNMARMFNEAIAFDQNIGDWDVSSLVFAYSMFRDAELSIENYDALLTGWNSPSNLQSGVNFNGGNSQYCLGEVGRQKLIDDFGWIITDGGESADCEDTTSFITTWKTDNPGFSEDNQIAITTQGSGYNYTIYWGDGNFDTGVTGDIIHTYITAGIYTVSITGDFPSIFFSLDLFGDYDSRKILSVAQWGDNAWSSMRSAFEFCENLDVTATDVPDLSNVTDMESMFRGCSSLIGNSSFNNWNVINVTDMGNMFNKATGFNQDISNWDVSNITSMSSMFTEAADFNQDIGNWDVGNVESMDLMFRDATSFNQNIGNWDVSNVRNMFAMFLRTSSFDQNLGLWNVINVTEMSSMFSGPALSTENYDSLLMGWSALDLQLGVVFGGGSSQYCAAEVARQNMIDTFGWFISDSGKTPDCLGSQRPFVTTWKTDNPGDSGDNKITIATYSNDETYNYSVDWGDGTSNSEVQGNIGHTYSEVGTYTVSISGVFPRMYSGIDRKKLVTIQQWGDIEWTSMELAFTGCSNLDVVTQDVPNLQNVNSLFGMFYKCSSLVGNEAFNLWDTSQVVDMSSLFADAVIFNKDLSNWDVSNVVKMGYMFTRASAFNQDISGWDVSNVTNMARMFNNAIAFDQNIGAWNVSNLIIAYSMFRDAALSVENYDALLTGWYSLPNLQSGVNFNGGNSLYCNSAVDRQQLIDVYGWTITDGGINCALKEETTASPFGQDNSNRKAYEALSMTTSPNPSSLAVKVFFSEPVKIIKFQFFDLRGRLIQTINLADSELKSDYRLDVNKLPIGTYLLRVFDDLGKAHHNKLIIKR